MPIEQNKFSSIRKTYKFTPILLWTVDLQKKLIWLYRYFTNSYPCCGPKIASIYQAISRHAKNNLIYTCPANTGKQKFRWYRIFLFCQKLPPYIRISPGIQKINPIYACPANKRNFRRYRISLFWQNAAGDGTAMRNHVFFFQRGSNIRTSEQELILHWYIDLYQKFILYLNDY